VKHLEPHVRFSPESGHLRCVRHVRRGPRVVSDIENAPTLRRTAAAMIRCRASMGSLFVRDP